MFISQFNLLAAKGFSKVLQKCADMHTSKQSDGHLNVHQLQDSEHNQSNSKKELCTTNCVKEQDNNTNGVQSAYPFSILIDLIVSPTTLGLILQRVCNHSIFYIMVYIFFVERMSN